jgi:hypothetical protein
MGVASDKPLSAGGLLRIATVPGDQRKSTGGATCVEQRIGARAPMMPSGGR